MPIKSHAQRSIADLAINPHNRTHIKLQQIHQLINWESLKEILSRYYTKGQSKVGRSAYPPLLLFKACLLQTWYGLSDYQLEDQLQDRIAFKQFCRLSMSDQVPDASVICRFRKALNNTPAYEELLAAVNSQLITQEIMIHHGTTVDASITPTNRKPRGNKAYELNDKQAEEPLQEVVKPSVDPEASWVKRGAKLFYGYKKHYAVESETGLVLGVHTTGARCHESKYLRCLLEQVAPPSGSEVLADKGYSSQENRDIIRQMGLKSRLQYKRNRGEQGSSWMSRYNKAVGLRRYKVERVFGSLKSWFKTGVARYVGRSKTHLQHVLEGIAYNLYRAPGLVLKTSMG